MLSFRREAIRFQGMILVLLSAIPGCLSHGSYRNPAIGQKSIQITRIKDFDEAWIGVPKMDYSETLYTRTVDLVPASPLHSKVSDWISSMDMSGERVWGVMMGRPLQVNIDGFVISHDGSSMIFEKPRHLQVTRPMTAEDEAMFAELLAIFDDTTKPE